MERYPITEGEKIVHKMASEFIIPKHCENCKAEIKSISEIGFEQDQMYLCKKCSSLGKLH